VFNIVSFKDLSLVVQTENTKFAVNKTNQVSSTSRLQIHRVSKKQAKLFFL